jgi:7-keto-8-aminopelargonate synthetase-like enzyme
MESLRLSDRTDGLLPPGGGSPPRTREKNDITIFAAVTTYLGYLVLIATGHVRDVCASVFRKGRYLRLSTSKYGGGRRGGGKKDEHEGGRGQTKTTTMTATTTTTTTPTTTPTALHHRHHPPNDPTKYAPLLKSWENFYTRRLYHRIQDCFNRPIASRPCATISVLERVSHDGNKTMSVLGPLSNLLEGGGDDGGDGTRGGGLGGRDGAVVVGGGAVGASYRSGEHYGETPEGAVVRRCLNLGSYNYLGFADDWDVTCRRDVLGSLVCLPSSVGSPRLEYGTTILHREVERIVSSFVGKEDAMALNMGFNTNATVIPALAGSGDLIVSDELNHTSIVNGARASGAAIRTFRHNDASDLENILREAIVYGQPRTRRPWNRILVVVEGIYSMEGGYCNLGEVVSACKRYGAYVYLDEAHSIGAMGHTGRGCCEYTGVDPADVDVLMGTFTKSFGGMGGYVAADRRIIDVLRRDCSGSAYHNSLSPVVCQQIISSFRVRVFSPFLRSPSSDDTLAYLLAVNPILRRTSLCIFHHKGHNGKRWNGHWKEETQRPAGQFQLLPHAPYRHGPARPRQLRQSDHARNALQSHEDRRLLPRVSQAGTRRGRGRIPCRAHIDVARSFLHLGGTHPRGFGQGSQGAQ